MEELLTTIANYGFPIVVSAYLLVRMETKLQILVEAIGALKEVIRDCQLVNSKA
jgi:hypothetical protein